MIYTIPDFEGSILKDEKNIETFSKDASIFKIKPDVVCVPKNTLDVSRLVHFVHTERSSGNTKISLTARSAGTDMSGGPLSDSIIVSFTEYINTIQEIGADYIIVEPGVYYRDVEKKTLEKGLIFPSYPASKELCAIGGILNNNSGGEKTLRYGKTLDYVQEVDMVCSDGNLYTFKELQGQPLMDVLNTDTSFYGDIHRKINSLVHDNWDDIQNACPKVSKNSAGYYLWDVYNKEKGSINLAKIICGAQGTLGLTTKVKLGLVPVQPFIHTIVIFVNKVSDIPDVVHKVLPHRPESFELYDDHTFKIAMKFLPDIAKRMGGNMLSLGFQFIPEMLMALTGGVPKVVLIAEFTGSTQEEVDTAAAAAFTDVIELTKTRKGVHVRNIKTAKEAKKYWTFRRESFNLLRSKLKGLRTAPFIEDVVIRPEDFPEFLPRFEKLLDSYNLVYTIAGHVGDGNLHVIPLMKLAEDTNIEVIKKLSEEVYALTGEYGGSITGEHNDGLVRTPFLHYMFSEKILELFKEVKKAFDPENIFNPGKKVGITWEEAVQKIDRTI
jgi:FAD/FMN-containing dehydrogenase